jgi:hypothetical protein
MSLICVDAD